MKSIVFVDKLKNSDDERLEQFKESSLKIGLIDRARSARSVLIKPNLTFPVFKKGVTTRAEFIRALVTTLIETNKRIKVFIAEGEGGYNSFSMSDAMIAMGYADIAHEYPQVELINLSRIPSKTIELNTAKGSYTIDLPSIFFSDVDFSISCPLPKVHAMTKVTLSLKNLWGCLPDVMRLKNHYMLPHIIAQVCKLLKFEYAFLDGRYGLTANGPMDGEVVEMNWFVAANNLGAFDATVSGMMGFDWKKIPHLTIANQYGLIPAQEEVQVFGEPDLLRAKFYLKRDLWNYPALAAFHSKHLTQFFYLSKYADFLHDVMYTFRKRPIPLNDQTRK